MYKDRLDYIRALFAQETAAQRKIREGTTDNISIHPEEGKLLQLLLKLSGARKIVEIGTFAGYSTHWLAGALPGDGHIWTIEKDAARAQGARRNIDMPNVTLIEGDARTALASIEEHAPFDAVFIDADKVNYLHYLDWTEKHVRKGGLIIGDNTFLFDAVWKDEPVERVRDTARHAMRTFNRRLADPQKYHAVMLPTDEGMTIAIKLF